MKRAGGKKSRSEIFTVISYIMKKIEVRNDRIYGRVF